MITIDGSKGEGGGQVLRSALTLSATTGQPFRIENIRAKRAKPGLMRQHLTCVEAASTICGGHAEGAEIGSSQLTFTPGELRSGNYEFSIGTAGSTGLVFQTVFPALLTCEEASNLRLKGGTHNPASPSYEAITESYLSALASADIRADVEIISRGFYPAGGGEWRATVHPSDRTKAISLTDRGALVSISAEAMVSNLPGDIAKRELAVLQRRLELPDDALHLRTYQTPGPGNCALVRLRFEKAQEIFVGFGEMGVSAEKVGERLAETVKRFLKSDAAVGHYLADQLLVPMALGAGGEFTMLRPSRHFETNAEIIKRFLDIDITYDGDDAGVWRVFVRR